MENKVRLQEESAAQLSMKKNRRGMTLLVFGLGQGRSWARPFSFPLNNFDVALLGVKRKAE